MEVPATVVNKKILSLRGPLKVPKKERESGKRHIKYKCSSKVTRTAVSFLTMQGVLNS